MMRKDSTFDLSPKVESGEEELKLPAQAKFIRFISVLNGTFDDDDAGEDNLEEVIITDH